MIIQLYQKIVNKDLYIQTLEQEYKPDWESFHIRASNGAFIQNVSVFAIGFAKHFLTETGGDMSITNSNSNFGAISLESTGYRAESFDRDDVGYITHHYSTKRNCIRGNCN